VNSFAEGVGNLLAARARRALVLVGVSIAIGLHRRRIRDAVLVLTCLKFGDLVLDARKTSRQLHQWVIWETRHVLVSWQMALQKEKRREGEKVD
jgi:hypothetical protein